MSSTRQEQALSQAIDFTAHISKVLLLTQKASFFCFSVLVAGFTFHQSTLHGMMSSSRSRKHHSHGVNLQTEQRREKRSPRRHIFPSLQYIFVGLLGSFSCIVFLTSYSIMISNESPASIHTRLRSQHTSMRLQSKGYYTENEEGSFFEDRPDERLGNLPDERQPAHRKK